ncbi:LOW QUALITY PROTEIN: serpin-like protein HMSD [Trichechus inunguis]
MGALRWEQWPREVRPCGLPLKAMPARCRRRLRLGTQHRGVEVTRSGRRKIRGGGGDAHQGFQSLLSEVNKPNSQYLLRMANGLFGESLYEFQSSFKDSCRTFYHSEVEELSFAYVTEESRNHINTWVAEKTEASVPSTSKEIAIGSLTKSVGRKDFFKIRRKGNLASVSHCPEWFCAVSSSNWETEEKPLQMMLKESTFKLTCVKEIFTQILLLPYVGKELNMIIMLPDKNTVKMVRELTYERFIEWTRPDKMIEEEVEVFLPKFKLEGSYDLENNLTNLGMADTFDGARTDVSGMSPKRDLFVPKVAHKVFWKSMSMALKQPLPQPFAFCVNVDHSPLP